MALLARECSAWQVAGPKYIYPETCYAQSQVVRVQVLQVSKEGSNSSSVLPRSQAEC